MAGAGNKAMKRGAILFAFNSDRFDYYSMAIVAAKRINHFLNLPVTVVTDENSIRQSDYMFDKTIIVTPDKSNTRDWGQWINKGRYQAYELTPYDETLLLDTDYVVNSDKLLSTFELSDDYCFHNHAEYFMQPGLPQETLSSHSFDTCWATVVMFKKTRKAKHLFECIKMIQDNFEHYANIHGFIHTTFRNDYALTIAARIVDGHILQQEHIIPWSLMHVGNNTPIYKNSQTFNDTMFTIIYENNVRGKLRNEYITIRDMDFHGMNKPNFVSVFNCSDIISRLNANTNTGGRCPLIWFVKDKNIIVSHGKTGSTTIRSISDYSCFDTVLSGNRLIEMINNEGYKLHVVLRDPIDRFRSGILEEFDISVKYTYDDITITADTVSSFIHNKLHELNKPGARNYHIGNWMDDIVQLKNYVIDDASIYVWDFAQLPKLLENLNSSNVVLNATSSKPQVCKDFLSMYDTLSDEIKEKIKKYLTPDLLNYKEMVNHE